MPRADDIANQIENKEPRPRHDFGRQPASLMPAQNSASWLVTPMANGTSGVSPQCAGKGAVGRVCRIDITIEITYA